MCPVCKDAIAGIAGLAQGLSWGTLLMIGTVFLVVAVISGIIYKAYR
jgi:hypothetical protein